MTLTLTAQEAQALLELLDLGVKSGGLRVATNGAFFLQKIQAAEQAEKNFQEHAPKLGE